MASDFELSRIFSSTLEKGKPEHTPIPWEAQLFDPDEAIVTIIGLRAECPQGPTNGMVGCTTLFPTEMDAIDGIGPERAIANAAFIVKCVNSHDALVKALEEIRAHALAYVSDADAVEWCHSIHEVAERALAGAVGGAR